jgi:NADPH-dependent ferric siderophore reductase
MASAKAVLGGLLGRLLFRDATVTATETLTPHFRRLVLQGDALRGVSWTPGDKLQVFLPEVGTRAYTPTRWDASAGETELLVYLHGDTPSAQWARSVAVGAAAQLFGPRGSLSVAEPCVVFGDETSVGLVKAAGAGVEAVLEATDAEETQRALAALQLAPTAVVARQPGDAHADALVNGVAAALSRRPGARLVLTGRAAAIQGVRAGLKARGVSLASARAKAYWAPGKIGLD